MYVMDISELSYNLKYTSIPVPLIGHNYQLHDFSVHGFTLQDIAVTVNMAGRV
jgi:hypothetical protein